MVDPLDARGYYDSGTEQNGYPRRAPDDIPAPPLASREANGPLHLLPLRGYR